MKTLYTGIATAVSGREGKVETSDQSISTTLVKPGSGGKGTNPEQLFAAGYAGCFGGAVGFLAKQRNLDVGNVAVTGEVSLNQDEDNGFVLSVTLDVALPNLAKDEAENLIHAAHQFCPYSKATRGNINVTLKLNGAPLAAGSAVGAAA
ncbi:MAG TPA: hypothetical protein DIS76_03915 [Rhodospirillaceae bacterium]|nr:hypothetical protein [Rhodospirillaceae bacterium]